MGGWVYLKIRVELRFQGSTEVTAQFQAKCFSLLWLEQRKVRVSQVCINVGVPLKEILPHFLARQEVTGNVSMETEEEKLTMQISCEAVHAVPNKLWD